MSAFFKIDQLMDFAVLCLTDFLDWRYIHSWLVFSTHLVNCCPMDEGTILVYCCPSTFVPLTSALLNLPKGKSLGRSKPATNS
jgi:hypothetical protein